MFPGFPARISDMRNRFSALSHPIKTIAGMRIVEHVGMGTCHVAYQIWRGNVPFTSVQCTSDSWSFLPKTHLWDILEVFRLDIGQISSNLLKKHLQNDSMPFFPHFYDIFGHGHAQK